MPDAPPSLPLWTRPALLLRRVHPTLAASVQPDLALLARIEPRLPVALPLLAVGLVAVFTLARFGVEEVYTESLIFLVLAAAIGIVAPVAGVLLVLLHGLVDIPRALLDPSSAYSGFGPIGTIAGRLIGVYLLWLLVVEISLMARAIPWVVMTGDRPVAVSSRRQAAIVSTAAAVALMTWIWTQAAGILIRPVFTWSGLGTPSTIAISNLQVSGMLIVITSAVVAGVMAHLRIRQVEAEHPGDVRFQDFQDFDLGSFQAEPSEGLGLLGQLVRHMLAVFLLGGMINGILDVVILAGASLASQPLAERILKTGTLRQMLRGIPWLIRFLIGFGVTFVVGVVINTVRYESVGDSIFFPLVLTVALGLVIFQVLLADRNDEEDEEATPAPQAGSPSAGSVAGTLIVAIAVGGMLLMAFPGAVLADNCSGLQDCNSTATGAAAAAAGAAAAAVGAGVATERNRRLRRRKRKRREEAEAKPAEPVEVDKPPPPRPDE